MPIAFAQVFTVASASIALLIASTAPAVPGNDTTDILLHADGALIPVEELRLMGVSDSLISNQESIFDALTPQQIAEELEQYESLELNDDAALGAPEEVGISNPEAISPRVTKWPCWINSNGYYKVTDTSGDSRCWASSGTVRWNSASWWYDVETLRPGNYRGHILYIDHANDSGIYYSLWRGPTSTSYSFSPAVTMMGLEIE